MLSSMLFGSWKICKISCKVASRSQGNVIDACVLVHNFMHLETESKSSDEVGITN